MSTTLDQTLFRIRNQLLEIPVVKAHHETIEQKTHVKVEYFAIGLGLILALSLFSGLGASVLSDMIGFLYPAYASLRAIESPDPHDDTEWLVYWVVFSALFVVENFLEWVLFWIPYYYPLKVTFLLWCMLPRYKGAQMVYDTIIKPLFKQHGSAIDAALNNNKKSE
jgi:receptor expression-enhancing protein 5/6